MDGRIVAVLKALVARFSTPGLARERPAAATRRHRKPPPPPTPTTARRREPRPQMRQYCLELRKCVQTCCLSRIVSATRHARSRGERGEIRERMREKSRADGAAACWAC